MKYLLFSVLLLAVLFPNCKKEQIIIKTPVPPDTIVHIDTLQHIIGLNQGSVLKNGALWDATCISYYFGLGTKGKFQLRMGKNPGSEFSEFFYIADIPGKPGRYAIKYHQTLDEFNDGIPDAAFSISNYDAGLGHFHPDTTRTNNFIEVLRYDTINNEVEGRFQIFMGLDDSPSTEPGVPDSVFLTDGKFYLKIQ